MLIPKLTTLFALVLLLLTLAGKNIYADASPFNLVPNYSFEEGGDFPNSWSVSNEAFCNQFSSTQTANVQWNQNMGNSGIKEKEKLSIALTPSNFTELRQVLEYLGRMLNISLKTEETKQEKFIEGRTGKILKNSKEIGILGEIYPSVLKSFHLKMPLAYLELSLDELI